MDLIDSLNQIASRVKDRLDVVKTEEATKNALIMPMLNALGYNVFDPLEVVPEFTADHGIKKGEKIDYAIFRDSRPVILIECKAVGSDLSVKHESQLFRYFAVTDARFAILTNGIEYRFFTDIEAPNRMDEKPFFEFNLFELDERKVEELKKFSKAGFDLENILSNASELKYLKEIKNLIAEEVRNPSDEFVKFFTVRVFEGKFVPSVKEKFNPIVRNACREYLREMINERLKAAIEGGTDRIDDVIPETETTIDSEIVTTEEELQGYYIVKAILSKRIPSERIAIRDTKSYCGILLDDNNRKPVCRLHFNSSQKYLGLFDSDKKESRCAISSVDDIYQYEQKILDVIDYYDGTQSQSIETESPAREGDANDSGSSALVP